MLKYVSLIVKIIENVVLFILGALFLILVVLFAQKYIFKIKYPSFNGITAFIVRTESMYPALLTNDIVLVDKKNNDYKIGDIVSYEEKNYVVTHRIAQINDESFILKGDANNSFDPAIDESRIVGKVVKVIPNYRIWRMVLSDTKVIICVVTTMCLFIVIKILMVVEEKMNGKEEKIFKN